MNLKGKPKNFEHKNTYCYIACYEIGFKTKNVAFGSESVRSISLQIYCEGLKITIHEY